MDYATNTIKSWDANDGTVTMVDGTVTTGAWTGKLMSQHVGMSLHQLIGLGTNEGVLSGTDMYAVEGSAGSPVISNPAAFLDMLTRIGMLKVIER